MSNIESNIVLYDGVKHRTVSSWKQWTGRDILRVGNLMARLNRSIMLSVVQI